MGDSCAFEARLFTHWLLVDDLQELLPAIQHEALHVLALLAPLHVKQQCVAPAPTSSIPLIHFPHSHPACEQLRTARMPCDRRAGKNGITGS